MSPMLAMAANSAHVGEPAASYAASHMLLVMVIGAAIGLALGMSWRWLVAALALFAIGNGFVVFVLALLIGVTLVRKHKDRIWRWLDHHAHDGEAIRTSWGSRFRARKRNMHTGQKWRTKRSQRQHRFGEEFSSGTGGSDRMTQPMPPVGPGPEQVLGLGAAFTRRDLDQARRRAAKECHPDLHLQASPDMQARMAERMRAINDAYERLLPRVA
ncbi:MAG: hypothetical protein AAFZ01_02630 [Pseudomonadota bacterium]